MASLKFDHEITALIVIDPYNDFISDGSKIWDRLKAVAEAHKCVPHMMQVLDADERRPFAVCYALQRRYRPGDYEKWRYVMPIQKAAWSDKTFENRTWAARSALRRRKALLNERDMDATISTIDAITLRMPLDIRARGDNAKDS